MKTTKLCTSVSKKFRMPFVFESNLHAPVKKVNPDYGDGDIMTGKGENKSFRLEAELFCEYEKQAVRMHVYYMVSEKYYGDRSVGDTKKSKLKDRDALYMEGDVYFSIADFIYEGYSYKKDQFGNTIKSMPLSARLEGTYQKVLKRSELIDPTRKYTDYFTSSSGKGLQSWLPASDLRFKIDDTGKELTEYANMGVKGYVEFTVCRIDECELPVYENGQIQTFSEIEPKQGNEERIDTFHDSVKEVLGRGYDICGRYADSSSANVKNPVLDIKKLNEYNRIRHISEPKDHSAMFIGEGIREYSSDREEELELNVSAHAFGASFKNETQKAFKMAESNQSEYRFVTMMSNFVQEEYSIQGHTNPMVLSGFLSPGFLEDLDNDMITPSQFVKYYGTHVVLGMQLGSSFMYNLCYHASTSSSSSARSFSDKTNIAYESNSGLAKPEQSDSTKQQPSIASQLSNLDKLPSCEELLYMILLLQLSKGSDTGLPKVNDMTKSGGSNPAGSLGGVDLSSSYLEKMSESAKQEDKTTYLSCFAKGGDASLASLISLNNDLSKYEEWNKTRQDIDKSVFVDFVRGYLIPIYCFVPNGHKLTPTDIKSASDKYQNDQSYPPRADLKRGVAYYDFKTYGKLNTEVIQGDKDLYTEGKKGTTYWELTIELLNFDTGKCGFSIGLRLYEEAKKAGKTVLFNHVTEEIILTDCSYAMIDTDHPICKNLAWKNEGIVFEASGTLPKHVDISNGLNGYFVNNVLLNHQTGRVLVIDEKHPLILRAGGFDTKDDRPWVGLQGTIRIPWVEQ